MQSMLKSFTSGLNQESMKQAQGLWSMLDQMASRDPQEYQNFINKNLKQGFQQIQKQRLQTEQQLKVTPSSGLLIQCRLQLQQPIKSAVQTMLTQNSVKAQILHPSAKLNINITHSPRVLSVLNHSGQELQQLTKQNLPQWKSVPVSFIPLASRLNDSAQQVYYTIGCVNSALFAFLCKDMRLLDSLKDIVFQILSQRLKGDMNVSKSAFYQIDKYSMHIAKQKKFKFLKEKKPQAVLLEPLTDREQIKKKAVVPVKRQIVAKLPESEGVLNVSGSARASQPVRKDKAKSLITQIIQQQKPDRYFIHSLIQLETSYQITFAFQQPFQLKHLVLDVSQKSIKLAVKGLEALVPFARSIQTDSSVARKKGRKLIVNLPYL